MIKKSVITDNLMKGENIMEYIHEPLVNTALLDEWIEKSGLKTSFICGKLGISKQAFSKKRIGRFAFRISEIYVICDLCHIPDDVADKIFYPKKTVISDVTEV